MKIFTKIYSICFENLLNIKKTLQNKYKVEQSLYELKNNVKKHIKII